MKKAPGRKPKQKKRNGDSKVVRHAAQSARLMERMSTTAFRQLDLALDMLREHARLGIMVRVKDAVTRMVEPPVKKRKPRTRTAALNLRKSHPARSPRSRGFSTDPARAVPPSDRDGKRAHSIN